MQNAPSVSYPVGRSAFWGGVLLLLGLAGLLNLALWWWLLGPQQRGEPAQQGWLAGGLLFCVVWAAWAQLGWRYSPVGRLQWDALAQAVRGERAAGAWRWHSDAFRDGAPLLGVSVVLDLQSRLLLRLVDPDGRLRWLWAERWSDPQRWHALRQALTAQHRY